MTKSRFLSAAMMVAWGAVVAIPVQATNNHEYGANEFDTVEGGLAPNGKHSIAAHGGGEFGYDHFHLYLMNAETGKKIGPLEEIKETLDTGADAFYAQWSADSQQVAIRYRVDRHVALEVRYRIANHRAYLIRGPSKVEALRFD